MYCAQKLFTTKTVSPNCITLFPLRSECLLICMNNDEFGGANAVNPMRGGEYSGRYNSSTDPTEKCPLNRGKASSIDASLCSKWMVFLAISLFYLSPFYSLKYQNFTFQWIQSWFCSGKTGYKIGRIWLLYRPDTNYLAEQRLLYNR